MSLFEFQFYQLHENDKLRPYIEVILRNKETNKEIKTFALIDSGADECAFPSIIAKYLGHNLDKGSRKEIKSANGIIKAYKHKNKIIIPKIRYSNELLIDFLPNLHIGIIGVNILENYKVTLDYPKKMFYLEL